MWKLIRSRKYHGCKFRRQVPVGPYIVDFLCVAINLVIEVDGDSHWQPGAEQYDKKRDEYLHSWGFRVLRIGHTEVLKKPDVVFEKIREYLSYPSPQPSPLGRGRTHTLEA